MPYRCKVCDYIIIPEKNEADNETADTEYFEKLADDWKCPQCGAGKRSFLHIP